MSKTQAYQTRQTITQAYLDLAQVPLARLEQDFIIQALKQIPLQQLKNLCGFEIDNPQTEEFHTKLKECRCLEQRRHLFKLQETGLIEFRLNLTITQPQE